MAIEVHRTLSRLVVWTGHLLVLAAALVGGAGALGVHSRGAALPLRASLPQLFPFATMSLAVDGLSAFFLLVICLSRRLQPSTALPTSTPTRGRPWSRPSPSRSSSPAWPWSAAPRTP